MGGVEGGKSSLAGDTMSAVVTRWSKPHDLAEETSVRPQEQFQTDNAQLVHSTGVNVPVMTLQGHKSTPEKSRPL